MVACRTQKLKEWLPGVVFSPDGQMLAVASFGKVVELRRVQDGALLRTFDHYLRCRRRFSDSGVVILGNDRSLPGSAACSLNEDAARADVEPLDCNYCIDDCDRTARTLFASHEFVSALRLVGRESFGSFLQRATNIREQPADFTGDEGTSGDDLGSKWKREIWR